MASNVSPIRPLIATAAMRFDISRSTLRAASSFSVQSRAIAASSSSAYGAGLAGEHGLHQALRDQIREAPIRRRRVRVVLHRETEVAGFRIARTFEHVLARPHQLDDGERQIREVIGIGGLARDQKLVERSASPAPPAARRRAWPPAPRSGPTAPASSRRAGSTTRCRVSSMRATTSLAAIMKSSMSSVARFFSCRTTSTTWPCQHDGPRLDRLDVERAVPVPRASAATARRRPAASAAPADRADAATLAGAGPVRSSQAPTRVVGQLRRVADDRAVHVA